MTDTSLTALWQRLELAAQKLAPERCAALCPPAIADDLAALRELGDLVPDALLASLAVHDGEDGANAPFFIGGGTLLSASAIVEHYQMLEEALGDGDAPASLDEEPSAAVGIGPVRTLTHSARRLPFMDYEGDITWFLDFDPLPGGTPGQVIRVDLEMGEWIVCADSYADFLADYAAALEARRFKRRDGEIVRETTWPPLDALPWLRPDVLDAARLEALCAASRPDVAWRLLRKHAVATSEAQRLRIEARAQQRANKPRAALTALDALRETGAETADDVLLRDELLQYTGKPAQRIAAFDLALERQADARLYVARARWWVGQLSETPGRKSHAATMRWLASPAGQQHSAVCTERALADYAAALALDDRIPWRAARAAFLLDIERWDDAVAAYDDLIARIEAADAPDAAKEDALQRARDGRERAVAREVVDVGDVLRGAQEALQSFGSEFQDKLMGSMQQALQSFGSSELQDQMKGTALRGVQQTLQSFGSSQLQDQMKGLIAEMQQTAAALQREEATERAALDADDDSLRRRASHVAQRIARMHSDIPERYAPFDPADLAKPARRWYDRTRDDLAGLGFRFVADVDPLRNTELSGKRVLLRLMLAENDTILAALFRVEGSLVPVEAIELESTLPDGRILVTNNTGSSNPFVAPPAIAVDTLPRGCPAAEVLAAHVRRLAQAGSAVPLPDLDAVLALQERQRVLKREHARAQGWISERELRGLLGGSYDELAPQVRAELASLP